MFYGEIRNRYKTDVLYQAVKLE